MRKGNKQDEAALSISEACAAYILRHYSAEQATELLGRMARTLATMSEPKVTHGLTPLIEDEEGGIVYRLGFAGDRMEVQVLDFTVVPPTKGQSSRNIGPNDSVANEAEEPTGITSGNGGWPDALSSMLRRTYRAAKSATMLRYRRARLRAALKQLGKKTGTKSLAAEDASPVSKEVLEMNAMLTRLDLGTRSSDRIIAALKLADELTIVPPEDEDSE